MLNKAKSKKQPRFEVVVDEGSFFHEPILLDHKEDKIYYLGRPPLLKGQHIPMYIIHEWIKEVRKKGIIDPDTAKFLCNWVINKTKASTASSFSVAVAL